jgi:hypothetical protein
VSNYDQFRTEEPRAEETLVAKCYALPEMFVPKFGDMPQEMQDAFKADLSIPCEGSGMVGMWCSECVFSSFEVE